MFSVAFFLVLIVIALTFIYAYRYKTLSKMSMRNAFRRKMTMLLIVAGSLTGTAFIVGSFAMNDSFQYFMYSGIRKNLGTIDEIVRPKSSYFKPQALNKVINVLSTSTYVDSILPIVVKETVAAPKGKIRSLDPRAITTVSFIGVDPSKLRQFGEGKNFPNVKLKGNEIVIGQAVANYLKVKVGDTIEALSNPLQMVFGTPPSFKIVGVVPQKGVLGYQGIRGFSLPIFVTTEQIKRFFGVSNYNQLLISNEGDYLSGVRYTSEVDEIIKKISDDSVKISNVKGNQIKGINSQQVGKLFILLSSFAIAAGALLIVNIYTMLADERKSSLGTLRAIGFSRKKTGFILYFEGFLYSLVASFVGSFVGLAVAWFMVNEFSGFFSTMTSELSNMFSVQSSNFSFHFNLISLIYGFSLGMIIPLVVLAFMALKIGRLNIVKAIRNIPDNPFEKRRKMLYFVLFFFVVFIALAIFGSMAVDAFVMYTGVIGAVFVFPSFFRKGRVKKYVGNFAVLFSIVFSFASNQIPYVQSASENSLWFLGLKSFSILLAALFFLSYNLEVFDKIFAKLSTPSLRAPFKLALAETSQNKRRTGMTIAMYAIVIFVISLMTIIPYSQVVQIQSGERTMFQGYDAVGLPMSGNIKVTKADMSRMNYVTYYATASMISVRYAINGHSERQIYQMVNANEKFLKGSVFKINRSIPEIKDMNSLWSYLKSHPGSVASFGLPRVNVGDTVEISKEGNFSFNFESGASQGMELTFSGPLKNPKKFRVVATFENNGMTAFPTGFYTTGETEKNAFGSSKSSNFLLVKLAGNTEMEKSKNFEKFLAFLKTRFSIGIFSKQMIDVFSDTIMSFVNIINSFLYFGLSVGIVGLAILILKTLHERRRTIGILKAIGFTKRKVFSSFFIETNFVVVLGILSGFFAGWITSYMIYSSLNLGKMLVPWGQILSLALVFYLISILATLLPIKKASSLPPAEVLRYYE